MNPRPRQQMKQATDLIAEGADWWREAADALSDAVPGLSKAQSMAREQAGSGEAAAQTEASLTELLTKVRRLAGQFDQLADRFAETAAAMRTSGQPAKVARSARGPQR